LATREAEKYFSRKIFFMSFQVPMERGRMEKNHAFAASLKKKRESFQLNLFFVNSMQFHAKANHVELVKMSMMIFSSKSMKCWQ
jgi:hypothetical protein